MQQPEKQTPRTVAVIDIGSNTIKLLVASRDPHIRAISETFRHTLETRLGKGISAANPTFSLETIEQGANAVAELVSIAREYQPESVKIVATSAVRDAANREDLRHAIRAQTGLHLDIITGQREAELIGAAIQLDPAISADDFYVFDLGGGSLECLRFRRKKLEQTVSLPLGCVRLTEKLVPNPHAPLQADAARRIAAEVQRVLHESGFEFSLSETAIAVGTGGTLTVSLDILAAKQNKTLHEIPRFLSGENLRQLLEQIGSQPYPDRLKIEKLSPGRADVFPTALATFLALIDLTKTDGLHLSLLNLRYGLAAELLR